MVCPAETDTGSAGGGGGASMGGGGASAGAGAGAGGRFGLVGRGRLLLTACLRALRLIATLVWIEAQP